MNVSIVAKSILNNPGNRGKRARKMRDAVRWQVHKRVRRTPKVLRLPNRARFMAYPDCVVSSGLIYADWPEYHELQFLRRQLNKNAVVIDVGANVGHVSLLLSDIVGHNENLVAFEPVPVTYGRLVENWKLNQWSTEQLFQVAVGDSEGEVEIPDLDNPDTMLSLQSDNHNLRVVKVPVVQLDAYRKYWAGKPVGLLKIDVEGYETKVFAGSEELLEKDRPHIVMFESLERHLEESIAAILEKHHYCVFQLNDNGQPDFSRYDAQNLFAMPQENHLKIDAE